jgi:hypothetical protein
VLSPPSPGRDVARALRIIAWLLSVCFATSALSAAAQDTTAEPPAPATEAQPASPAASEELSARAVASAQHELSAREHALHAELNRHPMVLPGLALGLGIPIFMTTVPIGAILLANAGNDSDSGAAHERRVGAGLLAAGAVGLAGIIYGAIQIRRARRQRLLAEYELRAIAVQRLVLASHLPAAALAPQLGAQAARASAAKRVRPMTTRGRTLLTGGIDVGYDSSSGFVSLRFTPGFGFFVRDRLALGAFLEVTRGEDRDVASTRNLSLGGGFRLIYELGLGDRLGLWFWPYLGYAWRQSEISDPPIYCPSDRLSYCPAQRRTTHHVFRFGLLLPLMFHLTESWAIGVGPRFEYDYASGHVFTTGIASQLSGSF